MGKAARSQEGEEHGVASPVCECEVEAGEQGVPC
jgi:hypothetical protein